MNARNNEAVHMWALLETYRHAPQSYRKASFARRNSRNACSSGQNGLQVLEPYSFLIELSPSTPNRSYLLDQRQGKADVQYAKKRGYMEMNSESKLYKHGDKLLRL
jgi:hypothetical protein